MDYQLPPVDPALEPVLRYTLISAVLFTVLYGAYAVVVAVSMYLLFVRHQKEGGQKVLMSYLCIAFVLATLNVVVELRTMTLDFVEVFFRPVDAPTCAPLNLLQLFGLTFCVLCGDALLLYRVHIMWNRRLLPTLPPLLLFLASFGIALVINATCGSTYLSFYANGQAIFYAWIALSVAFNLISTGMIAWRLLGHRHARMASRASGNGGRVRAVAMMLAESALLYTISGVVYLAVNITDASSEPIFLAFYQSLSYLNPAVIILRVALNTATQEASSSARMPSGQISTGLTTRVSQVVSGLFSPKPRDEEHDSTTKVEEP